MTAIYHVNYTKDGKGNLVGRSVGPKDSALFIHFADVFRDKGPVEGMKIFPLEWEWFDDDGAKLSALDLLPVFASGIVISDKAYEAVRQHVSDMPHAKITLDRDICHWILPPFINEDTAKSSAADATPHLFLFPHGAGNMCDKEFMKSWRGAGLTGAEFVLLAEGQRN